jgi:molecular chaperone HscA
MTTVTLTYPAGWERPRQAMLERAASQVGLSPARLVPEPVAAALYAEEAALLTAPDGAFVLVCDFGAGSFAGQPFVIQGEALFCLVPAPGAHAR